jgi:hypothetical protein
MLSGDKCEEVHTRLYLRNVSSSGMLLPTSPSGGALGPLPEPTRREGDSFKFNRCAPQPG